MELPSDDFALASLIIDCARGEASVPRQDETPWHGFYEAYSAMDCAGRSRVDAVIDSLADAEDPLIRSAVLSHQRQLGDAPKATANLLGWLADSPQLFDRDVVNGMTLRAQLLDVLCSMADPARTGEIHAAVFAFASGAGMLGSSIGRFLGMRGFAAVDTLVKLVKPSRNLKEVAWHAGETLGRSAAGWSEAERGIGEWPAGVRKEFLAGADYALRHWGRR